MRTRMDDVDALERLSGGASYDMMSRIFSQYRGTIQLSRTTIQYLYRKYGILKKLVNIPANQMTFRWGHLQLGGKDGDAQIQEEFDRLTRAIPVQSVYSKRRGLSTAFNLAQKAANKNGNGAILLDLEDGGELDEPINYRKLQRINQLFVLNRWAIKPLRIGGTTDYEFYQLGGVASNRILPGLAGVRALQSVHRSRVLWFRGEELDDDELAQTGGCDDSVFESIISSFFDYQESICGAKQMIKDFDIFVHKLNGLLDELADDPDGEYEALLQKRLHSNDMMRSVHKTQIIDKEQEDLVHSTRQVSGYSDLMTRILDNFLANTELTPAELLGKYPEGMAETGKTEQQNANDRTSRYQSEKFQSNIMDYCEILFRCKEGITQGKVPDSYEFKFNLLYPVTPPEQAELQLNYAQIDDINIRNGVYGGDDVAKSRYGGSDFQPSIVIDFKARDAKQKPPEEAPEDIDALLAGYQSDAADIPRLMPPSEVQLAARQGLSLYKQQGIKSGLAMTPLAQKMSMGYSIEPHEIQALRVFFVSPKNRKVAHQPPKEGFGATMWLMMGGDVGDRWSAAIARELGRRKASAPRTDDDTAFGIIPFETEKTSTPRTDDDTPIKRAIHWNDYQIGLQYQPLDLRHGKILPLGYGEFLGLVSAHDGMNVDVYVGPDLGCDRVFAITQLDHDTGDFDEVKFVIGVDRPMGEVANLYKAVMTPEHFGGIEEIDKDAISTYQPKTWVKKSAMAQVPPESHHDAELIKVEGELLSEQDWEAIADVSNADAEAALKQWKKSAPEQFMEILDAGEADETSNRPQN
jgi:phage-related protein (TIGR01555 family)